MSDINPENENNITGGENEGSRDEINEAVGFDSAYSEGDYRPDAQSPESGYYVPDGAEEIPEPESKTYGAVYTPDGDGNGEYHFTPYIKTNINDTAPETPAYGTPAPKAAPAAAPEKKKRSGTKAFVIVVASILVVSIVVFAEIAGILLLAKGLFPGRNAQSGKQGEAEITTADTVDYSNTLINIADSPETTDIQTRTREKGELMSLEDAVAAVKDSVVEIRTEAMVTAGRSQYVQSGAGSGIIISADGKIMTNHHVIDGATKITVRLTDGKTFEATLIGSDEEADIAVISIDPGSEKLTAAVLGNSDSLRAGQSIMVIGNPLGTLGGSVSAGIISATQRDIMTEEGYRMRLIQTDAGINPGNSGGGMFNLYGELVGVVNSKYADTDVESLGFAIPVNDAWKVADELMKYGHVKGRITYCLQGLTVGNDQRRVVSFFESYYEDIVVVTAVEGESSFQVGDVIERIGNTAVSNVSELSKALRQYKAGDTVKVYVRRGSASGTLNAVVEEAGVSD